MEVQITVQSTVICSVVAIYFACTGYTNVLNTLETTSSHISEYKALCCSWTGQEYKKWEDLQLNAWVAFHFYVGNYTITCKYQCKKRLVLTEFIANMYY